MIEAIPLDIKSTQVVGKKLHNVWSEADALFKTYEASCEALYELFRIKSKVEVKDLSTAQIAELKASCVTANLIDFDNLSINEESFSDVVIKIGRVIIDTLVKLKNFFMFIYEDVFVINLKLAHKLERLRRDKLFKVSFADKKKFEVTQVFGWNKLTFRDTMIPAFVGLTSTLEKLPIEDFRKVDYAALFDKYLSVFGYVVSDTGVVTNSDTPSQITTISATTTLLQWSPADVVQIERTFYDVLMRCVELRRTLPRITQMINTRIRDAQDMLRHPEGYNKEELDKIVEYNNAQKNGLKFYKSMLTSIYYRELTKSARFIISLIEALNIPE